VHDVLNLRILTRECPFCKYGGAYWCIPICGNVVNFVLKRTAVHTSAYWCIPERGIPLSYLCHSMSHGPVTLYCRALQMLQCLNIFIM
jgi:hypothetical protein